jgi:hypothetical protein
MAGALEQSLPGQAQQIRGFDAGQELVNVGQELEVGRGIDDRHRVVPGQSLCAGEAGEVSAYDDDALA